MSQETKDNLKILVNVLGVIVVLVLLFVGVVGLSDGLATAAKNDRLEKNTARCAELATQYEFKAILDTQYHCLFEVRPGVWLPVQMYP